MKKFLPLIFLAFLLNSCCKDHSDVIPGQNFIPDDILEEIRNNGQVIHEGFNPPKLKGKYLMSIQTLVSSNFPDAFTPGHTFVDLTLEFLNFNTNSLTLTVKIEEGGQLLVGGGKGSFISGEGNDFTIFVENKAKDDSGHELIQAEVYSGTLDANGIINLQRSLFMINDNGDPAGKYIENGQGRLIIDGDGYSEKI